MTKKVRPSHSVGWPSHSAGWGGPHALGRPKEGPDGESRRPVPHVEVVDGVVRAMIGLGATSGVGYRLSSALEDLGFRQVSRFASKPMKLCASRSLRLVSLEAFKKMQVGD